MRSKRVPARAASTTARTAMRTSSSASVVDMTASSPVGRRAAGCSVRAAAPPGELLGERHDPGIGVGVAGEPDDELDGASLGERSEELRFQRAQSLGQVDDDAPEAIRHLVARSLGGSGEEVALVVPGRGQQAGDVGGHTCRLAPARRARQRSDRPGAGGAQLAVEVAEGDNGRRVVVDGGVEAGGVVDDPLDGEVDHGRGDGLAAIGVQRRSAEQLGDTEDREDVDRGRAAPPAERPAGHDAGGVGRHDDGDGRERVVALGSPDRRRQRIERGRAVPGERDADRHPPDRTDRV